MAFESSLTSFSLGDQVRFREERLSVLTLADRKRLEDRVGIVQGYWNFTRKLTVSFPEHGGRPELRILSVDSRQLERVVEGQIQTVAEPRDNEVNGDSKLSQEDTDNLFG